MSLTNAYGTAADIKAELPITDTSWDVKIDVAGNAAARQIDGHTGWPHGFWADATVKTREYYADDSTCLDIPEGISSTTGLIVKTDTGDDGTYATTLTIATNFIVRPVNAADQVPVEPYTELRIVDYAGSFFPAWSSGRPGVQVTATFGWPAVPDDVRKAWIVQTIYLLKASDAVFGAIQLGEGGFATRLRGAGLNPTAEALLQKYSRPRVG